MAASRSSSLNLALPRRSRPVGTIGEIIGRRHELLGKIAGSRPRAVIDRLVVRQLHELPMALVTGSSGGVRRA